MIVPDRTRPSSRHRHMSSTINEISRVRVNKDSLLPTYVKHVKQVKHIKHRRANTLPLAFDPNPYKTQAIPPRTEHIERPWVGIWFNYIKENATVIGVVLALIGVIVALIK